MRLICPNCGAQYEVGLDVIPDDGRDVQCSNCGQTWFEDPKDPSAAAEDDMRAPAKPASVSVAAASLAAVVAQPQTAQSAPEQKPAPKVDDKPEPKQAAPVASTPPQPVRSQLDPSIADILREEAAREEAARKSESAGGLEQQADLGLTEPVRPRPVQPVPPMPYDQSHVHKDNAQSASPAMPPKLPSDTPGSRKELFPDIEEINSTLRSSADRGGLPLLPSEEDEIARRSSWRGFFVMITLIVILALIYAYADTISAQIPALSAVLSSYVDAVNGARLWLDNQIAAMLGDAVPPTT
ncbi:MAG: zinc-ribbon domain-containing protein [Alphaproteobacteria bacterium]|nr:zinc-ribbon domain-containing protein [Alphaproteobacteria bacterium]